MIQKISQITEYNPDEDNHEKDIPVFNVNSDSSLNEDSDFWHSDMPKSANQGNILF